MSIYLDRYYKAACEDNSIVTKALNKIASGRVLITGANGVVGYALARLLDSHANVDLSLAVRDRDFVGVDFFSPKSKVVDYENIFDGQYDYIFHCATHSQPAMFLDDWQGTVRLSTDTLLRLLEVTTKQLVFTSSTEIYSGATKDSEESDGGSTTSEHPRAIYIESKRLAEAACIHSGLGSISRIALAAGPFAKPSDTRVLYELIRKGRKLNKISLLGGHDSIRQYQYTGACALRMLVSGLLGEKSLYNNAGPYVLTLGDLARFLADYLDAEYVNSNASKNGDIGAPKAVKISMDRFNNEFPEMALIDPAFDDFIKWVIEDTQ